MKKCAAALFWRNDNIILPCLRWFHGYGTDRVDAHQKNIIWYKIASWRKASLILVDSLNPHQKVVDHLCPYSPKVGSCVRASASPDCLPVRMICIAWCNIYLMIHNDFMPLLSACETSAWCVMRQAEWVCTSIYIYIVFTNRELCIEIWTHNNNKMDSFLHCCGYCRTPMTTCSLLKKIVVIKSDILSVWG